MAQQQLEKEPQQATSQHWEIYLALFQCWFSFRIIGLFAQDQPTAVWQNPVLLLALAFAFLGIVASVFMLFRQHRLARMTVWINLLIVCFLLGATLWSFYIRGSFSLRILVFPITMFFGQLGILWFLTLRERSK